MKREKALLLVLAALQFVHIVDFMIMMPLGPKLIAEMDIDANQFSRLVSAYTFSAGIFGFLGSFFLDRFDRKSALLVIFAGFSLGTIACGLAPTFELLFAARVLAGAFGGVLGALVYAIISDAVPLERRSSAMGVVMAAFAVASVLGLPSGLFLANRFNWHIPFLALGGLSVLIAGLIILVVPNMRGHMRNKAERGSPFELIRSVLRNRNQLRALSLMIAMMLGQFTVIPLISTYMVYNGGLPEADLSYIYLVGGAATIITSPLIGKLADRLGRAKVFIALALLSPVPLFLVTNMGVQPLWLMLVVAVMFFVVVGGRTVPAMAMISATVEPQHRGGFMSLNTAVQQLSAGAATLIAGFLVDTHPTAGYLIHYEYVGYVAIGFSLLAIWIASGIKVSEGNKPTPAIAQPAEEASPSVAATQEAPARVEVV